MLSNFISIRKIILENISLRCIPVQPKIHYAPSSSFKTLNPFQPVAPGIQKKKCYFNVTRKHPLTCKQGNVIALSHNFW